MQYLPGSFFIITVEMNNLLILKKDLQLLP